MERELARELNSCETLLRALARRCMDHGLPGKCDRKKRPKCNIGHGARRHSCIRWVVSKRMSLEMHPGGHIEMYGA